MFPFDILVHGTLDHDILLGRDFTGSKYKSFETNSHLYLTNTDPMTIGRYKTREIEVPLYNEQHTLFQDLVCHADDTLPPLTTAIVKCRQRFLKSQDGTNQRNFQIEKAIVEELQIIPAVYEVNTEGETEIVVHNPTLEEITLEKDAHMARISFIPTEIKLFQVTLHTEQYVNDSEHLIQCQHINLDTDTGLSEEEKEKAFLEYLESGQYTPSMTGYIENKPSTTEMSLKDTKGWGDDEFEQQFDLQHLPYKDRIRVLQTLWKHEPIFSRHEMDIGMAPNIEMEIEVDRERG